MAESPSTHKAGNRLDLVFTRNCTSPNILVTPLHVSDHCFLSFSLPLPSSPTPPSPPPTVTVRRNLRSLTPSALAATVLSSLPPSNVFSQLSAIKASSTLLSSLSSSLDSLCPLSSKPARLRPPTPWLTDPIRADRLKLRAAERIWRKSKSLGALTNFHSLLTTFSSTLSSAKTAFFHSKIQSSASNPRKLYSTFSSLLTPPPLPPPSSLTADDFASFFRKKVDDIRNSFSLTPPTPNPPSPIPQPKPLASLSSFSPIHDSDILQLVQSNRPTTCPLDPIPSPLFQSIAPDILPFVSNVINSSLSSGSVPPLLKTAHIIPLLKKPSLDPAVISNYRPVSLLSFLSKTLERAVYNQLSVYLLQNSLLDPNQSGFKAGHSTETALLAVTEALQLAKSQSLSSVLLLLDLSAAFDTVDHQILLSSLAEMGISGSALTWFKSYLADRSYQVAWRGSLSSPHTLSTGVPQGSVLGPLLFSLYTKSLGSVISAHGFSYHCYADDTQLFLSFPPSETQIPARISACLADISAWMSTHHLKLNLGKTELLFLPAKGSPMIDASITVEGSTVSSAQSARSLGVTLDDQLCFSSHIAAITRTCRYSLHNIRRIRPFLTQEATQLLVQALVISRLDYCNSLLAGLPACAIKPLQLVQNAAARLVFNQPKFTHVTPLLTSLHWLPIAARIKFKSLVLAYQAAKRTAPPYLQTLISPYTPARPLRSASSGKLTVPSLRAPGSRSMRSRLFSVLTPRWWNDLPPSVRTAESLAIFRKRLKTHLFRLYYH